MTSELKPCPFCGSNDVEAMDDNYVDCYDCGAMGPDSRYGVMGDGEWNTRHADANLAAMCVNKDNIIEELERQLKAKTTAFDNIKAEYARYRNDYHKLEQKCGAWVWQDKYEGNHIHTDATAILESIDERLTSIERKVR